MKKIYFSLLFAGASLAATAQQAILPSEGIGTKFEINVPASVAAAGEDTLGLADFSSQLQITYDIGGSGYIFGTSVLDTSLSQGGQTIPLTIINSGLGRGFIVNDPYNVTGAMVWFALKDGVNSSPADLNISLHAMAEDVALTSPSSQSGDGAGPGAELASVALPFADVDTSSSVLTPTIVSFSSPVWVNGDIAVVVDLGPLYGSSVDTVAVYNEADGTSSGDGTYSYYRQAAQGLPVAPLWIASSALGLEADLAIFAIVQESGVGIEEQGYFNGVKMTTYPNPAVAAENITVQYGVETAVENVEVSIYTMSGQVVYTTAEGPKANGIYNLTIPAGTLSAGSYIYAIDADGKRLAKRLEILK